MLAGSKVLGTGAITLGLASVANAKYPVGEGLQEMNAAWNNESDQLDNSDNPDGMLGDVARKIDCGSACTETADAADTIVNIVSGNAASNISKAAEVANKVGDAVQRIEDIKELKAQ